MIYAVYHFTNRDITSAMYFTNKEAAKLKTEALGVGYFWIELVLN